MALNIIITGATGMVGEGVLLSCLADDAVGKVMSISRKPYPLQHPKYQQLLVPDFMQLEQYASDLAGYDACFFCAGISSIGISQSDYEHITYDTTMHVAEILSSINANMVFTYVSGTGTDSEEKSKLHWARVKGKTENDLMKLSFRGVYNFRPGVMKPAPGQRNVKGYFKPMIAIFSLLSPGKTLTLPQVAKAMINAVLKGYSKKVLEIADIRRLAAL